ncbi:MAG: polysaccharide biosynthesis C-terminal domain-containing protein [Turicibacter sanguinis]|uniref:oligosaccharide flippase family protein n=1 Tax=Turicibacter sanguinis TaxID=154288 RepID=UPI002F9503AC
MNLKRNIIYQFLYQILLLVIPLFLSKYVTNIFLKDTLGVYSYSYSIASYFVIIGMLGIQKYGTRVIAQNSNDEIKLRKNFWSLYYLHVLISLISLIGYLLLALSMKEDRIVYFIQGIYVASVIFDVTWLFYGIENFRSVVLKNSLVKIMEILLIIILVKNNNDLWLYTLIMSMSIFIGQAVMLPPAKRIVQPIPIEFKDIKPHIKPLFILSISVIATSVYSFLDKTILGILSQGGKGDVALYEYSEKIIKIPLSMMTSIGTVMLPRMSTLSVNKDEKNLKNYVYASVILISMIAIGAMFGVASISKNFVMIWYGEDYYGCIKGIILLSPLIFFVSFGDIVRTQFLIPNNKDKEYTISIVFGAILNFLLNLKLIPIFGLNGAIFATLITEAAICIAQFLCAKNDLPIKKYFIIIIPYFIFGIIMYLCNQMLTKVIDYGYYSLLLQIILGMIVYGTLSSIYIKHLDPSLFNRIINKK